ncbi:MAG TPA: N-acetylmuramoyl-L-alanine amidase [Vicinamibacterales bacterium]|nr:N-acetylmuramoyl-L-alanine amidase [Vicinamibacterales bacterium]
MKHPTLAALVTAACLATATPALAAQNARDMYNSAMAQERIVRDDAAKPTLVQMRRIVAAYESLVRKHPASAYCDNALWQAANLAALAFERFGDEADRKTAARLFALLAKEYPTSKLARQATDLVAPVSAVPPATAPAKPPSTPAPTAANSLATLQDIKRTVLPDGIRLTVDIDAEVPYYQEEIANPRRLFFDLKGVKTAPNLQDVSLKFDDDVVKEVRLGRHPQNTTRLVVDLEGVGGYSVYPLYGPYRLVIDLRRAVAAAPAAPKAVPQPVVIPPPVPEPRAAASLAMLPQVRQTIPEAKPAASEPAPLPSKPAGPKSLPPAAPESNSNGKFSLSRQLGLSVSRVVIDAGHGGHDPGAHGNGITESELTLDVALRLEKLLKAQAGVEVVMTRDTDVFIPLEERTAIANREGADLFLSIHANASRNVAARGIETYFLNFAMNPEAEAVAARENATSGQSMHSLPDIVKAIALNNKINESRDLAVTVQKSMAKRLGARNRSLKDLGVKQAPFVVLIGAVMPSVLAEISFVTNKQDGTLLKAVAYRQQIAQALFDAILNYQQGLKRLNSVAGKKATQF